MLMALGWTCPLASPALGATAPISACIKYTETPVSSSLPPDSVDYPPSSLSTMSTDTVPIPEVPGLLFLGSALDIDLDFPLGTFLKFAEKHGTRGTHSHAG